MEELIEYWYNDTQAEFAKKLDEYAKYVGKPECDVWVEFLALIDPDDRLSET